MKIPDNTQIQSVDLIVKNLNQSLDFYSNKIGFKIIDSADGKAYLLADSNMPYLISLEENNNAQPEKRNSAGLYHTAFRFKDRISLAKTFLHLHENGVKFLGFSDHLVSEAIYLKDPDGNGVELYTDKPKNEWIWKNGQIEMDTLPLNLRVLTNELENRNKQWNGTDGNTQIGHIHLKVTDLFKAEKFYSHVLGFNITNSTYGGALFMSAGGYHHHIGTNIWHSANGASHQDNSLGIKSFSIKIPDESYIEEIKSNAKQKGLEFIEHNDGISIRDYDNINVILKH